MSIIFTVSWPVRHSTSWFPIPIRLSTKHGPCSRVWGPWDGPLHARRRHETGHTPLPWPGQPVLQRRHGRGWGGTRRQRLSVWPASSSTSCTLRSPSAVWPTSPATTVQQSVPAGHAQHELPAQPDPRQPHPAPHPRQQPAPLHQSQPGREAKLRRHEATAAHSK